MKVLVGGLERAGHDGFVGLFEVNVGHAHAAPASLDRGEDVGLVGYKAGLLLEGEFEDAAAFLLAGEGGEDPVVEAEVGVVHVGAFDGSGKLEGEAAEDGYVRVGPHLFSLLLSQSCRGLTPLPGGKSFRFMRIAILCKFSQIKG